MSLAKHLITTSNSSQTNDVDVIVTSSGGQDMPRAAYRGGSLIGINSSEDRPPDEIPLEFIDWPFLEDDFEFSTHLDVVKRENPRYAVAPDIQSAEDFDSTIAQADLLNRHAEVVIVVPKGVKPKRIPSRFRVGLPAQDRFGGVPHPVWDYRNCESVHILGGSPARQEELSHYVSVKSVDTASPLKAAKFGDVWDSGWEERGHNYYDRIERSMLNLMKKWNERVDETDLNLRRLEVELPEKAPISDERVADPRGRETLCLNGDDEVPFPGRAYFYRDDTLSHREWKEKYR
jgi:hypothetical protein